MAEALASAVTDPSAATISRVSGSVTEAGSMAVSFTGRPRSSAIETTWAMAAGIEANS
ncbi:hypothetical protein [Kocuria nitroreducens]|uniref:hypothetical protein n=1 Tax=Kocuria nitroreducens TaxID=3058914 RepID=UPI0036DB38EE